jgi:hypothetical protein
VNPPPPPPPAFMIDETSTDMVAEIGESKYKYHVFIAVSI